MTRKSVQGGYCNWPDTGGCALTKLECDDPANFLSSRQMQDGTVRAHGGSCRWQDSVRASVLGRCLQDGLPTKCASHPQACPEGLQGSADAVWAGPDPECTVETTLFGRCDYGMCAWTHGECHEDNTWEAFDEDCTCDKVQVGACSRWMDGAREAYCAVSELACDEEQSWITPQEVMSATGFDCFLCREESPPASDTANDLGLMAEEGKFGNIGTSATTQTKIIVSTVVGAVMVLTIVGLVGWRVFKTKRAVKRATESGFGTEEEKPRTIDVEISENMGNGTDMENASVLSEE